MFVMNTKYFEENIKFSNYRCNTHPHQIHFELLSEHGLVGYLFLFYILFIFFKKNLMHLSYQIIFFIIRLQYI